MISVDLEDVDDATDADEAGGGEDVGKLFTISSNILELSSLMSVFHMPRYIPCELSLMLWMRDVRLFGANTKLTSLSAKKFDLKSWESG